MKKSCGTSFQLWRLFTLRLLKLFYDNSAVVSFSKNTRITSRSKHIDVKFFFVK